MRRTVTLSVPDIFFQRLEESSRRKGVSRSRRAFDLMERQLWFEELHDLQAKLTHGARAQGLFTDEDVFERLR